MRNPLSGNFSADPSRSLIEGRGSVKSLDTFLSCTKIAVSTKAEGKRYDEFNVILVNPGRDLKHELWRTNSWPNLHMSLFSPFSKPLWNIYLIHVVHSTREMHGKLTGIVFLFMRNNTILCTLCYRHRYRIQSNDHSPVLHPVLAVNTNCYLSITTSVNSTVTGRNLVQKVKYQIIYMGILGALLQFLSTSSKKQFVSFAYITACCAFNP